jgi:amidase
MSVKQTKIVHKDKGVYSFSKSHKPVEYVDLGELVILETEDAVGGQIKSEDTPLEKIDWNRVNKATGPIHINGVEKGDTLVVDILDIEVANEGVILVVPGTGALAQRSFKPKVKIVKIKDGVALFNNVAIPIKPMIGTIGVAPEGDDIPTSTPHKHGGNLDCIEVCKGARLYLPVSVNGALFAAGDLHAVQADGELCVSSIEVEGKILLRFNVIKGRKPEWPIVEFGDHYSILVADEDLDKAVEIATEYAVRALMKAKKWSFEDAYMFSSLGVNIAINQVVDPKKGVRAILSKNVVSIYDLLNPNQ